LDSSWVTATPTFGYGKSIVIISVTANLTTVIRTVTLTFRSDDLTKTVTINQDGKIGGTTSSITWSLDNNILTISGNGPIPNVSAYPWYEYRNSIHRVVIEDGVTSIGSQTFSYCTSLTLIVNQSNTPQPIYSDTFYEVPKGTCILKVPAASINAYKAADSWKDFTNIVAI
jgi:hypothetical protein